MALTATSAGWQKNEQTGRDEYVVCLRADRPEDVPDLTAADIWNQTPMRLEREST